MPVVREHLSVSQFAELVGIDPARFNGVEVDKRSSRVTLVLEPEDAPAKPFPASWRADEVLYMRRVEAETARYRKRMEQEIAMAQGSGTFPQLTKGGKKVGGRKPKC